MIKQRNFKDCAICCLAMFLDKPYDQIRKDVLSYHKSKYPKRKYDGCEDEYERAVLWKYGVKVSRHESDYRYEMKKGRLVRKYTKKIDAEKLTKGKKALISAPSLNFKNYNHMIYWDGKRLRDPSNLKRYTKKKAFNHALQITVQA